MIILTVPLFLLILIYFYALTFKPMIANAKGIKGTIRLIFINHQLLINNTIRA
jgi:hypothetical protein